MRPPRFRLRTLLVAVVVVGISAFGIELVRRRGRHVREYRRHARQEYRYTIACRFYIANLTRGKPTFFVSALDAMADPVVGFCPPITFGERIDASLPLTRLAAWAKLNRAESRLLAEFAEEDHGAVYRMMQEAGWDRKRIRSTRWGKIDGLRPGVVPEDLGFLVRGVFHHRRLRQKYQHAAVYPWLPVPPDPPPPGR